MKVDLHIHTTASDGCWTPEELVQGALAAGLEIIAVTDHDSVENSDAVHRLGTAAGIAVIAGVEICATHKGKQYHILGYGIDCGNAALLQLLQQHRQQMEAADHESIRKLIVQGLPVDYEEYRQYRNDPRRGGWASLNFLIDKGLCSGVQDFFSQWFRVERGIVFPEFTDPQMVIATIRQAGGLPVLAHPGSEFHGADLERALADFSRLEIAGFEGFHPNHTRNTTRRILSWCRNKSLLVTGGSDCHGGFVPLRRMGRPEVRLGDLRLDERLWSREVRDSL